MFIYIRINNNKHINTIKSVANEMIQMDNKDR